MVYVKNEWWRVHSGAGNLNGVRGASHLCYIMGYTYKGVNRDWNTNVYPSNLLKNYRAMYYSGSRGTVQNPGPVIPYNGKNYGYNEMRWFKCTMP